MCPCPYSKVTTNKQKEIFTKDPSGLMAHMNLSGVKTGQDEIRALKHEVDEVGERAPYLTLLRFRLFTFSVA